MSIYQVKLSEVQEKVLLTNMISIPEWITNAIFSEARRSIDAIVKEYSGRQPAKLTMVEKTAIVQDTVQAWFEKAIQDKVDWCVDGIVRKYTDLEPSKLTMEEKLEIVKNTDVETGAEINARAEKL